MIAHLRGVLLEKRPNRVIVETGGVGYDVTVPISTYTSLPEPGAEVRLHVYTHVREDTLALYGFLSQEEKALFERLVTVTGVGPKLAVTVLSGLPAAEVTAAIRQGQPEKLVRIPGVGKKTAERIVLELRDKLGAVESVPGGKSVPLSSLEEDVISALVNLGCTRAAAESAVKKVKAQGAPESFEPFFRRALEEVR